MKLSLLTSLLLATFILLCILLPISAEDRGDRDRGDRDRGDRDRGDRDRGCHRGRGRDCHKPKPKICKTTIHLTKTKKRFVATTIPVTTTLPATTVVQTTTATTTVTAAIDAVAANALNKGRPSPAHCKFTKTFVDVTHVVTTIFVPKSVTTTVQGPTKTSLTTDTVTTTVTPTCAANGQPCSLDNPGLCCSQACEQVGEAVPTCLAI